MEEGRHPEQLDEQGRLSSMYFLRCAYFPPTALAFGLGGFDKLIKKKTDGRVTEMSPHHKYWAKYLVFPLGLICYAIVAVVTTIVVLSYNGGLAST